MVIPLNMVIIGFEPSPYLPLLEIDHLGAPQKGERCCNSPQHPKVYVADVGKHDDGALPGSLPGRSLFLFQIYVVVCINGGTPK